MPLELRVLSGARSGVHARFTQPAVSLGRRPHSDLQLDPDADLDVSGRHAEIVQTGAEYTVRDLESTNGTFVNGARLTPGHARVLHDGDVIALGAAGPKVEVSLPGVGVGPLDAEPEHGAPLAMPPLNAAARWLPGIAIVLLLVAVASGYWLGHREAPSPALARADTPRQSRIALQQGPAPLDLTAISARNDSAVAFLVSELDGQAYGGTAFGITRGGLLVTNRHNVRTKSGADPSRLGVKYANTGVYLRAHVVRVSSEADLALVQVDAPGSYPVVSGVARATSSLRPGAPVATIGFPEALETPMEGAVVKTSLAAGTVSKLLPTVLQIDSYATHGSSGTPVFDASGRVVGVIWGGERTSEGRIVYAVPSDVLVPLLPAGARGILR